MVSAIDAGCGGLNKREEVGDLAVITMKSLLEAGVHFGHQTRRWNPKWHLTFSQNGTGSTSSTCKRL